MKCTDSQASIKLYVFWDKGFDHVGEILTIDCEYFSQLSVAQARMNEVVSNFENFVRTDKCSRIHSRTFELTLINIDPTSGKELGSPSTISYLDRIRDSRTLKKSV